MNRYYAGIGSRETPAALLARFTMLATTLADAGWTLRSGGAQGADAAFEQGLAPHHPREIFLPWPRFAGNHSRLFAPTPEAFALAERFHPVWDRCSSAARRMHARNMHQVLGQDLATPVEFIACWTPDGAGGGGTGQAIRLARSRDIPIFDFGLGLHMHDTVQAWLKARDNALRAEQRRAAELPPAPCATADDEAAGMSCGP